MSSLRGKMAIILAGGEAKRFQGVPKQLLPIGKETILERLIRQAKRYADEVRMIADSDPIYTRSIELGVDAFALASCKVSVEHSMWRSSRSWAEQTIYLWGDVIFSKPAIEAVFNTPGLHFFGSVDQREGFALSFGKKDYKRISDSFTKTNFVTWHFYRWLTGCPVEEERYEDEIFYNLDPDWTTDIDTPDQYMKFLVNVVKAGRLDDEREDSN